MSFNSAQFDASQMRLGYADKLGDVAAAPVSAETAAADAASGIDPAYRAKATEAAVKFESFFIGHMLHQMRSGTRELAGDDSPSKDQINQDMLDMADNLVADQLAGQRAFGVADAILRQLLPPAAPVPLNATLSGAAAQNPSQPAAGAAAGAEVATLQNNAAALNPAR